MISHDFQKSAKSPCSRFCSLLPLPLAVFILTSPLLTPNAFSSQVTLAWVPNTEPDLAGYELYYGTASGNYAQVIHVNNTTMYTVTNITAGYTYYFGRHRP